MPTPTWEAKPFWSLHTHSRYSFNDAMPQVEAIVAQAQQLGYPALGLTDHGRIPGVVSLYNLCRKAGIEPLPGCEFYITDDSELMRRSNEHLTVAAYSETGYRNLCRLSTLANRKFFHKPRLDFADLADLSDHGYLNGLVVSTGCFFGVAIQRLINRGPDAAIQVIESLARWFPQVYVELQNHGIDNHGDGCRWYGDYKVTDDDIVEEMMTIANEIGLPVLIAQDSHYIAKSEQPLHDLFKSLIGWGNDPDDATFPGDGYHMVNGPYLSQYFTPRQLDAGLSGLFDLAQLARVRIPELETFQMKVPDVTLTGDAFGELETRVFDYMKKWVPRGEDKPAWKLTPYRKRADDELEVIDEGETAGLILLTAHVCDFMRVADIWYAARGSASGSLVVRTCQISQLDPVARGNDFSRFLSRDRTKPPDIDLDVEHTRRDDVKGFLEENYVITQVGTLMTYSLFDDEDEADNQRGSLMKRYHTVRRKRGLEPTRWAQVPEDEQAALTALANMELISGFGTHAAGFVIAPDAASLAQLPLAFIPSSKTTISAYPKKDVERLGYVKLDILGLRDRTAFKVACRSAGIDPDEIPYDDPEVYKRISAGKTEGIFQLQGYSAMKGAMRLKPKNIDDLSAAMALFRPAAQHSGATSDYLSRRNKKAKIPARHADIMDMTLNTYGVLLYQEQMVGVLRKLGLPPDELQDMLDAVKASNKYTAGAAATIEAMLPKIRGYAEGRKWTEEDIVWLQNALIAFADYSFNKSHADQYADNAYVSAWLAVHHPQDFWMGLLTAYINHKKEPSLVTAARKYGVRIRPANVNLSQVTPIIDPSGEGVRRGLLSVKGVGNVIAYEIVKARPEGGFRSMQEFGQLVNSSKVSGAKDLALGKDPLECGGAVLALYETDAFHGLEDK